MAVENETADAEGLEAAVDQLENEEMDEEMDEEMNEESPEENNQDEEIQALRREIDELNDRYLRKQADMDNYKKRLIREKQEALDYANKRLLLDIITVIDDFERAVQSAESARDFDSFHDGIVIIEKQFVDMLERNWQLLQFAPEGEEFDPEKHEAMMLGEYSDTDKQTILQVFQKGYILKDIVLRAAKVKVSQPASAKREADASGNE